jgi:hypothetical protein
VLSYLRQYFMKIKYLLLNCCVRAVAVFCDKYSFDTQEPSPYTSTNSKSKRYFCWQGTPAYAWVVIGFLNIYVGAVPRTARNFRRVQGNAPYIGLDIILDLEMVFHHKRETRNMEDIYVAGTHIANVDSAEGILCRGKN